MITSLMALKIPGAFPLIFSYVATVEVYTSVCKEKRKANWRIDFSVCAERLEGRLPVFIFRYARNTRKGVYDFVSLSNRRKQSDELDSCIPSSYFANNNSESHP